MVLSRRERYIAAATIALTVILAADRFVLGPLLDRRDAVAAQVGSLGAELARARNLIARRHQDAAAWNDMRRSLRADPVEAESQILHLVQDAARESGVALSLVKPERLSGKSSTLPQISFQTAGAGSMGAVSRFLWLLERAGVALRITELQLSARKEGLDDLSVQLRLSTLYLPHEPAPATSPASRRASEDTR